jgi:hypothetical protein
MKKRVTRPEGAEEKTFTETSPENLSPKSRLEPPDLPPLQGGSHFGSLPGIKTKKR